MPTADNLEVIETVMRAFNVRNWSTYFSCFADAAVTFEPDERAPIEGKKGLRRRVEAYLTAFPDVTLEKERLFGAEDWVCLNSLFHGTHLGPLPGQAGVTLPPKGRKVRVHGCSIFRLVEGRITQFIGYYDQVELFTQLGYRIDLTPSKGL